MSDVKKAVETLSAPCNFGEIATDDLSLVVASISAEIKRREQDFLVKTVTKQILENVKKETEERAEGYKDWGAKGALQGLARWVEELIKKGGTQ